MVSFKLAAAAITVAGLWCAAAPAAAQGQFAPAGATAQGGVGMGGSADWQRDDRDRRRDGRSDDRDERRGWRSDDRDDGERRRRDRRFRGGFGNGVSAFYYGGYGSGLSYDDREGGFFSDGDAVRTANGRVRYDYDRGYPYEYYRARPAGDGGGRDFARAPRCSIERNVRVCRD